MYSTYNVACTRKYTVQAWHVCVCLILLRVWVYLTVFLPPPHTHTMVPHSVTAMCNVYGEGEVRFDRAWLYLAIINTFSQGVSVRACRCVCLCVFTLCVQMLLYIVQIVCNTMCGWVVLSCVQSCGMCMYSY